MPRDDDDGAGTQEMQLISIEELRRGENAKKIKASGGVVLDPRKPLRSARALIARHYTCGERRTIHHHSGQFHAWSGAHYPAAEEAEIRALIYRFLDAAVRFDGDGDVVPFDPTRNKVTDVVDALKAEANLPATVQPPAWLDQVADIKADEIVSCANGLLHLPTRQLLPHTPLFFTPYALEFAYDPKAPAPEEWLGFLKSIWPDDEEAIKTLQEVFGYFLSVDTSQQKLFLLVGPKRSGKGTIARILTALLGRDNVSSPTLAELGTNFGLASLIGKSAAVIGDARLGGKADQQAIAERLLSISGEDSVNVDRKHMPVWTGRLRARFLIITNILPRLSDASGALASRFVVLRIKESFYGREDKALTDRLLRELPGILNWALDGWHRLSERGHFVMPESSDTTVRELEDLGSPIAAFVRECCRVGPELRSEIGLTFERWQMWCQERGHERVGTSQLLGRDLRSVIPNLDTEQKRKPLPGNPNYRERFYTGFELLREDQQP